MQQVSRPLLDALQLEGAVGIARKLEERGGGLLADEMGVGKTVQTLAAMHIQMAKHKV